MPNTHFSVKDDMLRQLTKRIKFYFDTTFTLFLYCKYTDLVRRHDSAHSQ